MKRFWAAVLWIGLALPASAQDTEDDAIVFNAGLPMPTLLWKGDTYRLGDEPVLEALAQRPLAASLVQGYRAKQGLGAGLGVAAAAGFFSSLICLGNALGGDDRELYFNVSGALLATTFLSAAGSLVVHLASYADLYEAVEAYNQE